MQKYAICLVSMQQYAICLVSIVCSSIQYVKHIWQKSTYAAVWNTLNTYGAERYLYSSTVCNMLKKGIKIPMLCNKEYNLHYSGPIYPYIIQVLLTVTFFFKTRIQSVLHCDNSLTGSLPHSSRKINIISLDLSQTGQNTQILPSVSSR